MPLWKADVTYGSWLFENSAKEQADKNGGIGYDPQVCLPKKIERCKPDYSIFALNYSLGYTFRDCYRDCCFCKVPCLPQDRKHYSIYDIYEPKYDTIELLNNNIFMDARWEETFRELSILNLAIIDNGSNDLRLLNHKKAWWISRLRWKNQPKFAWDRMSDEKQIKQGLKLLQKFKINAMIYVLMGFDTTPEEDLYRCEIINSMGFDPFPMLYKETLTLRKFRRFVYLRYYRVYKTIAEAWKQYRKNII